MRLNRLRTSRVIGISLGFNTSASLVSAENGIELAISEERLINSKNTKQFPINAIKECLKVLGESEGEYVFAVSSYETLNSRVLKYLDGEDLASFAEYLGFYRRPELIYPIEPTEVEKNYLLNIFEGDVFKLLSEFIRFKCEIPEEKTIIIHRVNHHLSHRLPAYYLSGQAIYNDEFSEETPITVTADGFGDGSSLEMYNHATGEMLAQEPLETSLGLVYQYVTGALGFKEHQHEGKITGLAALGVPKYVDVFKDEIIYFDYETKQLVPSYLHFNRDLDHDRMIVEVNANIFGFNNMIILKEHVYDLVKKLQIKYHATREDIAASVQSYVERMIVDVIKSRLMLNGLKPQNTTISLAGGLFANVKVNYSIYEVLKPRQLFVLPPMGDEGTSIGAAIATLLEIDSKKVDPIPFSVDSNNLYLGPKALYTIIGELNLPDNFMEEYRVIHYDDRNKMDQISMHIASLLAEKKIVCVSVGRQEFGPRALGNHSILYDASKKETNDSLNERLNRSEFMPFAPITNINFANDLFLYNAALFKTMKYMTIAVPVSQEFVDNYKSAYHVDYTARPQVVVEQDSPFIFKVIEHYHTLTGKKVLINTSFNLHNSPIIYDNQVAVDSFIKADLDALLLDNMLIVKRDANLVSEE